MIIQIKREMWSSQSVSEMNSRFRDGTAMIMHVLYVQSTIDLKVKISVIDTGDNILECCSWDKPLRVNL